MSDRTTPETDDQPTINAINDNGYQVPCVDIEFARKLERERDEAREKYDNLATEHMLVVNKLCEERDEAQNASEAFSALAWKLEGERNEAREVLRELYFAVQRKFAEWSPKNNINAASEEAAK